VRDDASAAKIVAYAVSTIIKNSGPFVQSTVAARGFFGCRDGAPAFRQFFVSVKDDASAAKKKKHSWFGIRGL
jgi:hypothetical protein